MPPRLKRFQHEGHLHFLTFSCYRRLPYLDHTTTRICFEHLLEQCRGRHRFDIHGYVLMPNHVHLLVSEPELRTLESTLRVLKGELSKLHKGDRVQFWQRRYHDFNVFSEKKRIEKLKYMHRYPVQTRPRRPFRRLALEQLPPLRHRPTRPSHPHLPLDPISMPRRASDTQRVPRNDGCPIHAQAPSRMSGELKNLNEPRLHNSSTLRRVH